MKHIFSKAIFCMATLLLTSSLWAQDIIVTTDSKKIEAKILEVSDLEIKYKEKDYLDGPTFVMTTDKISSVLYANGRVVLYNQTPAAEKQEEHQQAQTLHEQPIVSSTPSIDESTAEVLLLSGNTLTVQITDMKSNYIAYILNGKPYTMPASQIEKVTFVQNGQVKEYNSSNGSYMPNIENTNTSQPIANQNISENAYSSTGKMSHSKILGEVYIEALGYVGKQRISSKGTTIEDITSGGFGINVIGGARFNQYVFTGFGLGLNTMFYSIETTKAFEMGSPLFVDFKAFIPTSKKQIFPYVELSVGPLINYLKTISGYGRLAYSEKISVLAFFQANIGIDINHFTMGVGYELLANSTYTDHLFCIKIGGRI